MGQSIVQVDAFTQQPFSGNPAAVCVLSEAASDRWMLHVAQEMNLSETAFLVPQADGFQLRWFTPTCEVKLCGHATLASAHVLWTEGYLPTDAIAKFHTQSGLLLAQRYGDWIQLDFPVNPATKVDTPESLSTALQASIVATYHSPLGYLVELASEQQVRRLTPNFEMLKANGMDVIVTSAAEVGSEVAFVSRFFAPTLGIPEDPVTGSAHCCLAPFWRDRLGQDEFLAYQASQRGGQIKVRYDGGDRVLLLGQSITVMRGELAA